MIYGQNVYGTAVYGSSEKLPIDCSIEEIVKATDVFDVFNFCYQVSTNEVLSLYESLQAINVLNSGFLEVLSLSDTVSVPQQVFEAQTIEVVTIEVPPMGYNLLSSNSLQEVARVEDLLFPKIIVVESVSEILELLEVLRGFKLPVYPEIVCYLTSEKAIGELKKIIAEGKTGPVQVLGKVKLR